MKSLQILSNINFYLILSTYIFFSKLKFSNSQNPTKFCNDDDIGSMITDCTNNKRKVIFYWKQNCNPFQKNSTTNEFISLPETIYLNECKSCEENKFLKFDSFSKSLYCADCPFGSYSMGNNLIIDGNKKDWSEETLKHFSSFCLLLDDNYNEYEKNKDCSGTKISKENDYIISSQTNKTDVVLISNLVLNFNLAKKGKISFEYRKETEIIDYEINGIFKLYVNYFTQYSDFSVDGEWKKYSFIAEPGYYTILFIYSKRILKENSTTKDFNLKIKSIFIEGIENTKSECILCNPNSPNKIRCENCPADFYYNEQNSICEKCPENSFSEKSSIGKTSCISKRKCDINDGNYFLEFPYEKISGNLFKRYKYKINPRSICDKSNFDEKIFENFEDLLIKKSENFCGDGLCLKTFNEENEKFVCEPCEGNNYTNSTLAGKINQCEFAETKKIFYIFSSQYSNFTKLTRFSKLRPHNENYSKISLVNFNGTLITGFELPNYLLSEINSSFNLNLNEGQEANNNSELKIVYELKRKIEDNSKETIFLNVNGDVVDFINLKENAENVNKTKTFIYSFSNKLNKFDTINFSLIYKRENCTSENSNENLIEIKEISVTNTLLGGNYKCIPCKNGLKTKNCENCSEGKFPKNGICEKCEFGYYRTEELQNCTKCPIGTFSTENRKSCLVNKILESKAYSFKFLLAGLEKNQKKECEQDNKLCYESFLGPIEHLKESEIYYLSYDKRTTIDLKDYSYSTSHNKKPRGHIFFLKNSKKISEHFNDNEKHENIKNILNVGNHIEKIKAFPYLENKFKKEKMTGYYIKYSNGDICSEKNGEKKYFNSYVFVICDKYSTNTSPIYRAKSEDKCTIYFEWRTFYGCKICNKDETQIITGACSNGMRENYYDSKEFCIITSPKEFLNKTLSNLTNENENFENLIDTDVYSNFFYEDSDSHKDQNVEFYLKKFYKNFYVKDIYDRKNFNFLKDKDLLLYELLRNSNLTNEIKDNLVYLESNIYKKDCRIYEDFSNLFLLILILVPIFYISLIIYFCVVYIRYKKIYKQYSRLKDEKEIEISAVGTNDRNPTNKIELGNQI